MVEHHPVGFLTCGEAAKALGVCSRTIWRWIEQGTLTPVVHTGPGGKVWLRLQDVEKVKEAHRPGERWY